jgi:hypothetical protein
MGTKTSIGVYLDYSVAFLLEQKDDENLITIIRAASDHEPDVPLTKQHRNREFVRRVCDMVKLYDRISVSGNLAAQRALIRQIQGDKDHKVEVNSFPPIKGRGEQRRLEFINRYFND